MTVIIRQCIDAISKYGATFRPKTLVIIVVGRLFLTLLFPTFDHSSSIKQPLLFAKIQRIEQCVLSRFERFGTLSIMLGQGHKILAPMVLLVAVVVKKSLLNLRQERLYEEFGGTNRR